MDGPATRSGHRLGSNINYPLPPVDCQILCVWKPPVGPRCKQLQEQRLLGERQDMKRAPNMWTKYTSEEVSWGKKGVYMFHYNRAFMVFQCLIMRSSCIPLKQEMRVELSETREYSCSRGLFPPWVTEWRSERRLTGFDCKDLCQAGRIVLKQLGANIWPSFDRQLFNSACDGFEISRARFLDLHFLMCREMSTLRTWKTLQFLHKHDRMMIYDLDWHDIQIQIFAVPVNEPYSDSSSRWHWIH